MLHKGPGNGPKRSKSVLPPEKKGKRGALTEEKPRVQEEKGNLTEKRRNFIMAKPKTSSEWRRKRAQGEGKGQYKSA